MRKAKDKVIDRKDNVQREELHEYNLFRVVYKDVGIVRKYCIDSLSQNVNLQ